MNATRRMVRLSRIVVFTIAAGLIGPAAFAQMTKVETPTLRLVYFTPSEDYLAPSAAQAFADAYAFLTRLFNYQSPEKVTVLLADFADYGNASTVTIPFNALRVQIAPIGVAFETVMGSERMHLLMNHELVHVITMDQATGRDRVFRRLFGGKVLPLDEQPESILYFFLTSPRVAVPSWYLEGAAVFADTWENGGIGRAQGGYDEMVWRAMVRDNARFYDPLGLAAEGSRNTFQVEENSYLYGTRFMTWLAYRYSPDRLIDWLSRRSDSQAYYARQFERVYGMPLARAWSEWQQWERTFQRANLDAINKYPLTPYTDLSKRGLGSVSRAFLDDRSHVLYAGFNTPGTVANVGAISLRTGTASRFIDIKDPSLFQVTSIAYDPAGTIFYTTDNHAHRDLVALDIATRRTRILQKDLRVGELAFNRADKSLWGVRSLNGLSTIVRIEPPYRRWKQIVTLPYGETPYDLDISSDGSRLSASFGDINGHHNVRIFALDRLQRGDAQPAQQFDAGSGVPNDFVFSPDGRYLYGSSYYTGVSNIFRYDLAAAKLEAVSNTDSGFFRPIPLGGDELIVFRYTGQGFVPARITARPLEDVAPITFLGERTIEKHPVLKSWLVTAPSDGSSGPAPAALPQGEPYRIGWALRSESFFPIVQGYKHTQAIGWRFNFSDPLQLNHASVSVSYSPWGDLPERERVHLRATYERYDWHARASWNDADFYDLFGPTKVSRKGYSVTVGHATTLLFDAPRLLTLNLEGTAAGGLDQLPEYQNVPVKVDRLYSVDAALSYSDVRSSLGHVDDEKGQVWSAVAHGDYVNGAPFFRASGHYDAGAALPLAHSSLWLRTAAGFSPQRASEPFANFYFGGFGNNWVDHQEVKRFREYYAFPGAALNEIGGRNFVRSLAEWQLPPLRFRHAGTPGFYASFLRPSLFAGGLATNLDAPVLRRRAGTFGGQIDVRLTALSALEMTFSAGAAVRIEKDLAARREGMISLSIRK